VRYAQRLRRRVLQAPAASSPSVVHAISHALASDAIRARAPSAATAAPEHVERPTEN
jgi:hypothetical protein